jgi:Serine incorporator (Serinc)
LGELSSLQTSRSSLQVVSFLITIASLMAACFSTASSHREVMGRSLEAGQGADPADEDARPYDAVFLHFTFTCATCFVLMALTNWSLQGTPGRFDLDRGTASMWAKIATQWLSFLLYSWILVAPRVVNSRSYA